MQVAILFSETPDAANKTPPADRQGIFSTWLISHCDLG
jgi:hypothetical protein